MGWWDGFTSFANGLENQAYFIKHLLKDWVFNIADVAVSNAAKWHSILNYSWDSLKDYILSVVAIGVEMAYEKIDDLEELARLLANNAYQKAVTKIDKVYTTINTLDNKVDTKVSDLRSAINAIQGTVSGIVIPGAATVRSWLSTDFSDIKNIAKAYTDGVKSDLLASMASMESVAGAARVALVKKIDVAIDLVEKEAKTARTTIKNNLDKAIDALENSSKTARGVLETSLNRAMDALEKEAKQAREVIEGTLIQLIESVEDALERAITDLERTFRGLLDVLGDRVEGLEGWVAKASSWFDTEINKYQSRVVTWIVDGFEGILDRVFK